MWEAFRLDWMIISCHVLLPVFMHLFTFSSPRSNDIFQCMTCLSKILFIYFFFHSASQVASSSSVASKLEDQPACRRFMNSLQRRILNHLRPRLCRGVGGVRKSVRRAPAGQWPDCEPKTKSKIKIPKCPLKLQFETLIRNMFLIYLLELSQ